MIFTRWAEREVSPAFHILVHARPCLTLRITRNGVLSSQPGRACRLFVCLSACLGVCLSAGLSTPYLGTQIETLANTNGQGQAHRHRHRPHLLVILSLSVSRPSPPPSPPPISHAQTHAPMPRSFSPLFYPRPILACLDAALPILQSFPNPRFLLPTFWAAGAWPGPSNHRKSLKITGDAPGLLGSLGTARIRWALAGNDGTLVVLATR